MSLKLALVSGVLATNACALNVRGEVFSATVAVAMAAPVAIQAAPFSEKRAKSASKRNDAAAPASNMENSKNSMAAYRPRAADAAPFFGLFDDDNDDDEAEEEAEAEEDEDGGDGEINALGTDPVSLFKRAADAAPIFGLFDDDEDEEEQEEEEEKEEEGEGQEEEEEEINALSTDPVSLFKK